MSSTRDRQVTKRTAFYGSVAAALEVGISLRQLYYWVEVLHAVQPSNHKHGERMFRRFTAEDVARLVAVKRLLTDGYTLRAAILRVSRAPSRREPGRLTRRARPAAGRRAL